MSEPTPHRGGHQIGVIAAPSTTGTAHLTLLRTAYGAPDAMVYALWSRLFADKAASWAQSKVLAVDGLRFMRNPPAGELLRGRMTVMGKDPVGDEKGIVIASHDLLDESGRLVFACLTRAVFSRR